MKRVIGWGFAAVALAAFAPSSAAASEKKAEASEAKGASSATKSAASEPKIVREPDKVVVRHKTTLDFNDVRLEGELTGPEGGYVPGREATHFDNLLKPRTNFLEELEKSGEGL